MSSLSEIASRIAAMMSHLVESCDLLGRSVCSFNFSLALCLDAFEVV